MTRHKHYIPVAPDSTLGLFAVIPPRDIQQETELARVTGAISKAIIGFLRARLNNGWTEFHAADLREWVAARVPTAPASADRILRDLRKSGRVDYRIVNRAKSLYRIVSVT